MGLLSRLVTRVLGPPNDARAWHAPPARLRAMWPQDVEYVLPIDRTCFHCFAWTREDFAKVFAIDRQEYGIIAEAAGRCVGFGVATRRPHAVVLLNLAILPAFRRLGIGRMIVDELCRPARKCHPDRLFAMVRESNLPAQMFFKSMGWKASFIRQRPWLECEEDGYCFRKKVGSEEVCGK